MRAYSHFVQYLSVTFSGTTGLLKNIKNLESNINLDVSQTLMYYRSYPASGETVGDANRASGAYAFRPADLDAKPISSNVTVTLVEVRKTNTFYFRNTNIK